MLLICLSWKGRFVFLLFSLFLVGAMNLGWTLTRMWFRGRLRLFGSVIRVFVTRVWLLCILVLSRPTLGELTKQFMKARLGWLNSVRGAFVRMMCFLDTMIIRLVKASVLARLRAIQTTARLNRWRRDPSRACSLYPTRGLTMASGLLNRTVPMLRCITLWLRSTPRPVLVASLWVWWLSVLVTLTTVVILVMWVVTWVVGRFWPPSGKVRPLCIDTALQMIGNRNIRVTPCVVAGSAAMLWLLNSMCFREGISSFETTPSSAAPL